MSVYYNEIDPFAVAWLRELMKAQAIPDGEIDTRSITDVSPDDLRGFRQCHFFAGIGGWAYALRLAGWPAERECWTGSCPCQPFSMAGAGKGADDSRHLWPAWFRLIRERRPVTIFGEQVASKDGLYWLDLVFADLEGDGYAVGPIDLPACSVGAPHRRNRLWIVADHDEAGRERERAARLHGQGQPGHDAGRCGAAGELDDAAHTDRRRGKRGAQAGIRADGERRRRPTGAGRDGRLVEPERPRLEGHTGHVGDGHQPGWLGADAPRPATTAGPTSGFWRDVVWIPCTDGRARPAEPGSFPLAHGIPARVGRLRGYGNAIVPQVAAEIIAAYLEIRP